MFCRRASREFVCDDLSAMLSLYGCSPCRAFIMSYRLHPLGENSLLMVILWQGKEVPCRQSQNTDLTGSGRRAASSIPSSKYIDFTSPRARCPNNCLGNVQVFSSSARRPTADFRVADSYLHLRQPLPLTLGHPRTRARYHGFAKTESLHSFDHHSGMLCCLVSAADG